MTLTQFVREHVDLSVKRGEAKRVFAQATTYGFTTTVGTVNTIISGLRREAQGLPKRTGGVWPEEARRGVALLKELQAEMATEVGFTPTLSQVIERLLTVYRRPR